MGSKDRVIQTAVALLLLPILEADSHPNSHAYHPKRGAHGAMDAIKEGLLSGRGEVIDADLSGYLDRVNHDILMHRIGQTIRDQRVPRWLGNYLRAGIMVNGVVIDSVEGTPQGGRLSLLLANISLDALDQELTQRELAFSRYADDCNIYVGSERAADRVLASVATWIAEHLRLEVIASKSG